MIVYHGSSEVVRQPDILHSHRALDFGKGFYVTTVSQQAERRARRKAALVGGRAMTNIRWMTTWQVFRSRDSPTTLRNGLNWCAIAGMEIRAYPNYDQLAFITQRAIDRLLRFEGYLEM